jgi:hypothetical protein
MQGRLHAADAVRIHALATRLGSLREGRKAIIVVGGGFATDPSRERVRLPDLQAIVRAANRFEVAIYPFDPHPAVTTEPTADDRDRRVSSPEERSRELATLRTLATETNGDAVVDGGELLPGLRRVAQDLDAYYVVSYTPSTANDGKLHAVRLRVKRQGALVRARTTYWAPSADELRRARLEALAGNELSRSSTPLMRARPQHFSPLIRPWFRMERGAEGRTRIVFMWTPADRPAGDRRGGKAGGLMLSVTAADGTTVFKGPVSPIRDGVGGPAVPNRAVVELAPGRVALEMAIQDINDRPLDSDIRDLEVPDLNGTRTIIGKPEILRARTMLDFRALSIDPDAPPAAGQEFHRAERLLIRVPAHGPGDTPPVVTAKLLNPLGHTMRSLAAMPASPRDWVTQFEILLAPLAPGHYTVELTATGTSGEAKEVFPFRVIG